PTRAVKGGLVPRIFPPDPDDPACGAPSRSAPPLNRADLGGHRFVEHDEVDLRDVESLLADRGGDEDVHLPGAELLQDVDLFLLREAGVLSAGRLTDEPHRPYARDPREVLRDPIRGRAVMGEDDDLGVRLLHELLADDP